MENNQTSFLEDRRQLQNDLFEIVKAFETKYSLERVKVISAEIRHMKGYGLHSTSLAAGLTVICTFDE